MHLNLLIWEPLAISQFAMEFHHLFTFLIGKSSADLVTPKGVHQGPRQSPIGDLGSQLGFANL